MLLERAGRVGGGRQQGCLNDREEIGVLGIGEKRLSLGESELLSVVLADGDHGNVM